MSQKPPSSGKYFTVSPKGDRKSGTFIERSSSDGRFVIKSMDGKVFEGARSAANSKLREVSGKFLTHPDRKK